MDQKFDMHKAAGILIKDRKLLVVRGEGKDFFKSPGGKLQSGENSVEALIRELKEELQIAVSTSDLERFGSFYAKASEDDSRMLLMDVFKVKRWIGEIRLNSNDKIKEYRWVDSSSIKEISLASIFAYEVFPRLLKMGLID